MRKKGIIFFGIFFLLGIFSCGGGYIRNTYRRIMKVKLTSSSKIAYGKLYINGVYKGLVYRNKARIFRAAVRQYYRVKVTRTWDGANWYRYRKVYIGSGRSVKWVFLHPIRQRSRDDEGE